VFQEGGFVIPFLGGVLVDAVGFEKMCCTSAAIPLIFTGIFCLRINSLENELNSIINVEL